MDQSSKDGLAIDAHMHAMPITLAAYEFDEPMRVTFTATGSLVWIRIQ